MSPKPVVSCILSEMPFRMLADLVVVVHVGFVSFVVLGAVLVWRWRWLMWLHLPAVGWGVGIEWTGGICPLTPLENYLRHRAGQAAYGDDFIERYLLPLLYPGELTRTAQIVLGAVALGVNVAAYGWLWHTRDRR